MYNKNKTKVLAIKNYYKVLFQATVIFFLFLAPLIVFAQNAGTGLTYECPPTRNPVTGAMDVYGNCSFDDLIRATVNFVNKIIIFTLEFSVIVIAYAGFNYMISGDNPNKRAEANKMLRKVATGIFFILAAWLIVNLISRTLLTDAIPSIIPRT